MGGNMSWPRFRGRNNLIHRPNYYTGGPNAPVLDALCPSCSAAVKWNDTCEHSDNSISGAYLSGEIDRMVYGWWLSESFQQAIANYTGTQLWQVKAIMNVMLTADTLPTFEKQTQWKGLP